MKLIRQPPDTYLCQACCAAMLAGVGLDYVLQNATLHTAPDGSGKQYLTNREAAKFLLSFNLSFGAFGKFDFEKLDVSDGLVFEGLEKLPALVGVRSKKLNNAEHAVVWDPERSMILDPQESEPKPISGYEVYEWFPVVSLEQDWV